VYLHPLEKRILGELLAHDGPVGYDALSEAIQRNIGTVAKAASWLRKKGLVRLVKEVTEKVELGREGLTFLQNGFPERVLLEKILEAGGGCLLKDAKIRTGFSDQYLNVAILWGKRKHWLELKKEDGEVTLSAVEAPPRGADEGLVMLIGRSAVEVDSLPADMREAAEELEKRPGVLKRTESRRYYIQLTEEGRAKAQTMPEAEAAPREITQLTPRLISSGEWRNYRLARFDIDAPAAAIWPGKKQPYLAFLDDLKWRLVGLGFKEMEGPIVELMFFNCDCLFMPQDHPAREIHDIYHVKSPTHGDLRGYLSHLPKVAKTHENGWRTGSTGYGTSYSAEEAKRLVLRSHGTSLSVRTLLRKGLEIPGKYFSVARCYRPELSDRSHLTEFNQVEGIVVGEGLTLRDLLGVLARFATDIAGADEVRFKPDYFPFTEPSIELVAYKKGYGWLEFGGSGIFRPEVTLPLGIREQVLAWGLGVDRLYMMKAKIDDIRTLFSQDLGYLRRKEMV